MSELKDKIFIEVGANHPTYINNTYRFYRLGARGIIVEPNPIFEPLYRKFRTDDVFLRMGCAESPGLFEFFDNGSTDVSGFLPRSKVSQAVAFLPCLPLYAIQKLLNGKRVFLLSIDVEGMDCQVLRSAGDLINNVDRVLIEFGDAKESINAFLQDSGFELQFENRHNLFFLRNELRTQTSI
ncbi:MAG: FkbM family methyltransferase [bacterium]|nr:FkbM family methyltransferase [bacterium]